MTCRFLVRFLSVPGGRVVLTPAAAFVRSLSVLGLLVAALSTPAAHAAQSRAFIVTTDFQTGGISTIDLTTRSVATDVATVYKDARARWYDGKVYVLNRFGADNVQVLDPAQAFMTVRQFSVGNGANPSDIVVVAPDKAYVSLYGRAQIQRWNPINGTSYGDIDLSMFADGDGLPEADRMARFGRWLFVALQRLDNFVPTDSSLVAVIDTEADTVLDVNPGLPGKQAIVLPRVNPVTGFAWDPIGRMFHLGCVGAYGALDGGVVRIDPTTLTAAGVSITETALGGDISDLEWDTTTHAYAIVSDAKFNTKLVSWNSTSGTFTAPVFATSGFGLADIARNDRGELYVCDNSFAVQGVRVFSTATDLPLAGPLDTGLPPYQVLFDGLFSDVTGVRPAAAATLDLSVPRPNPARGVASFRLTLDRGQAARVDAYDLAGRHVRTLIESALPAGSHDVRWDLRDARGSALRPGVYLVRARVGGEERTRRVSVVE